MKSGSGRADYLLYVDRKIIGVIEAKPEGPRYPVRNGRPTAGFDGIHQIGRAL
jgi:type I site-specific restriction endonuclease